MLAIIIAGGPPNWTQVNLPAGRSRAACVSAYNRLLGVASTVPMSTTAKPRTPSKKNKKGEATSKRKLGGKGDMMANAEGGDDEEATPIAKKRKKEEEIPVIKREKKKKEDESGDKLMKDESEDEREIKTEFLDQEYA